MKPLDPRQTANYLDFNQLKQLHSLSEKRPDQSLKEVARQFEALFLQMVMKNMRSAKLGEGILDSQQSEFYQELLDHQVIMNLVKQRSVGMADIIVKQLQGNTPLDAPNDAIKPLPSMDKPGGMGQMNSPSGNQTIDPVIPPEKNIESNRENPTSISSPEDFFSQLWPLAEKTAAQWGLDTQALMAQAALETGFGRHIPQRDDGSSSFNVFGIKAGKSWQGPVVNRPTLEYQEGVLVSKRDGFRAYTDFAAAFNDYAHLIGATPRYRQALDNSRDPERYFTALQAAGYSSDPQYANKIMALLMGTHFQKQLSWLKE